MLNNKNIFSESILASKGSEQPLEALLKAYSKDLELKYNQLEIKNCQLESDNSFLREQIKLLKNKIFGRKSEIISSSDLQLSLFNEAEEIAEKEDEEKVEIKAHTKRKKKKKQLPDDIERRQTIVDLTDDKICKNDGHKLVLIEEKVCEKLEIIPAQTYINEIVERRYECTHCDEKYAPENQSLGILPHTIASPSLLSFLVVSKYCDALPLYRIAQILAREEIFISRQTFARWIIETASHSMVLINLLRDMLIDNGYIRMDETPIQVLNENGRSAQSKSYMWVQHGQVNGDTIVLFDYKPTRSGDVPKELLEGFSGYLQVDGYAGYNTLVESNKNIIRVGCWDHCRRGFVEAQQLADGKGISNDFLYLIKNLYKIEDKIYEQTPEDKLIARQSESLPILKDFKKLAESQKNLVPPKMKIGQAINYALNQWPTLIRYIEDGRLSISNILAENAIRSFAVGRQNWLFADTPNGADASAALYSLSITATQNKLNPGKYFKNVFHNLPHCKTIDDFEKLLPLKSFYRPPPIDN